VPLQATRARQAQGAATIECTVTEIHRCIEGVAVLRRRHGHPAHSHGLGSPLAAIEACWGAPEGTEDGDKLDVLLALVEIYEAKRWPIEIDETFDPVDVLRMP
jgi:hypothetical protein